MAALLALLASAPLHAPLHAQSDTATTGGAPGGGAVTADQAIAKAKDAYGPPAPEKDCKPQEGDEIVVCARDQDNSEFRVKSTAELNPDSKQALDDGVPRAPDVAGDYIFKGPPTVSGICGIGLNKCPPPPAIFVDVTKLPQAPEGSDADKIAKGEIPE
ncbi:MAG: hypothetical protein IE933_03060 [Sphingomonadales bacterium]|nr:hypothetical protein [Sphingomonadales bacterium]MBD3774280.1 hypothetical protein [Paracoccaceae bacterium]